MKRQNSKKRIIVLVIILAVICAIFFVVRRKNISGDVIQKKERGPLVCGVNDVLPTHCVAEKGILYGKNHSICYLDLATDIEYVLCDEINCTHLTSACSSHYSDDMNGLALYGGYVYLFDMSRDGGDFEFIQMDTSGNHRKVLAKIPVGNFDVEEWYLLSIANVYYCGDYAWVELNYEYTEKTGATRQQTQCIRVSLDTGNIAELTSLKDIGVTYTYEGISEQQILISKSWSEEKKPMYAHYACNVEKLNLTLLEEYESIITYNQDGSIRGIFPKYIFLGEYGDGFLFYEVQWELPNAENNPELEVWNTKKNLKEPVCRVEHGASIAFGESNIGNNILDGENILFALYKENGMIDIANVHLPSGEIMPLFEDTDNVTFRIVGQTEDVFIGKVYDLGEEAITKIDVYAVKKADYYEGNFDNMKHLQTIRRSWLG